MARRTTGAAYRVSRRNMFRGAAAVAGGALPGRALGQAADTLAKATRKPIFFTKAEFALVDELTETIIPTDDHSPGARSAEVAWDIDRRLGQLIPRIAEHAATRARFKKGLVLVDKIAQSICGTTFLKASPDQRITVMDKLSAHESKPVTDEEKFFVEVKTLTTTSYYTSEIGIKQEIEYKGNTYWEEFVGFDPASVPVVPVGALKKR